MSADVDAAVDLLRGAGWVVTPPPEPDELHYRISDYSAMAQADARDMIDDLRLVSLDDAEKVETQYGEAVPPDFYTLRQDLATHQRMVIYMPATPISDDT